jgi:hypothetical protein
VVTPRSVLFACEPAPQYPPVTGRTLGVIGHVKAVNKPVPPLVSGEVAPVVSGPAAPIVSPQVAPVVRGQVAPVAGRRIAPVVPQRMPDGVVVAFPRPDRA